jgi:ubiquinone/menaquinone biosynthesis C-methylase UbiE
MTQSLVNKLQYQVRGNEVNGLCCPKCHSILSVEKEGEHYCPGCGEKYRLDNGIIDFTPDDSFYWGEITQEEMIRVNQKAETEGWLQALRDDAVVNNHRDMAVYILDNTRLAGLFHYYNSEMNDTCLDLGSGWGPLSFGLSQYYAQVYSVDGVLERLRFQAIRARQEHTTNLKIIKSSLFKLPLPDQSMSVVIVNGLLEWVGLSHPEIPPDQVQVNFLKEVLRVLKPGGRIYIGIENRIGIQFIMGGMDHSGLSFTSLMPRWLASQVVKFAKRKDYSAVFTGAESSYRTLTYTYWSYKKLLENTGYCNTELYWTWPSYNLPRVSGTMDGSSIKEYLEVIRNNMNSALKRTLVDIGQGLPKPVLGLLLKSFAPYFLIVADKEKQEGGIQNDILNKETPKDFLRTTPTGRPYLEASYCLATIQGERKIVRVKWAQHDGTAGFVTGEEKLTSGHPVQLNSIKEIRQVASWLADFQLDNQKGTWPLLEIEKEIHGLIAMAKAQNLPSDLYVPLDQFEKKYTAFMSSCSAWPKTVEHGEFEPQNVLVSQDLSIDVLHWDLKNLEGNCLMDSGAFFLALLLKSYPSRPSSSAVVNQPARAFEAAYCHKMHIPLHLAPVYYALRGFECNMGGTVLDSTNYLCYRHWLDLLTKALKYYVAADLE